MNDCIVVIPSLDLHGESRYFCVAPRICSISKDCRATDCDCNAFPDLTQRRLDAAFRLFLKAASDPCHILHDIIPLRSSRSGRFVQPPSSISRRRDCFVPCVRALMQKTFIL